MRKRFTYLRIISCLLALLVALGMMPGAVFGGEHRFVPGKIHIEVETNRVPTDKKKAAPKSYAAKLDPREEAWYRDNIQVRDQGDTGLCWAFAASTAAAISYAKEHPGETVPQMSPAHLGRFFCQRVNDPLGNTGGDYNNPTTGYAWYDAGGTGVTTMQHLATWSGLAQEKAANNYLARSFYPYKNTDAYDDVLVEAGCDYHYGCTESELKALIQEHGAAVVSLYINENNEKWYFSNDEKSYYCDELPAGEYYNHEVTVIGWDDNYSKDNFVTDRGTKPSKNGAWLIQNSWGTDSNDKGYFWAFYESDSITNDDVTAYEMMPAGTYDYQFQYDGNAYPASLTMDSEERVANVYMAPRQISLESVGFTTFNDGPGETDYDIDIYTGLTGDLPDSGVKAGSTQHVTTTTAGYKSFPLDIPVAVDPGEKFAVVITFRSEKTVMGCECSSSRDNQYTAAVSEGQSFVRDSNGWTDVANYGICCRIKAQGDDFSCAHQYKKLGESGGYEVFSCSQCGHMMRKAVVLPTPEPKVEPTRNEKVTLDKTAIKKVKGRKKALTVKWKRQNQLIGGKHITGYQIRYSLKANMKKARTLTVKGYKTTSRKITRLKKHKKYFVQVRTYYKAGEKTYYSAWSPKKAKKTK